MTREIKFRVWDKKNNCWLAQINPQGNPINNHYIDFDGWIWKKENINNKNPDKNDSLTKGEFEIMQFTGLYDRTKKPIYEGDIVEWKPVVLERKMRGKVIWHEGSGAWFVKDDLGDYDHLGLLLNIKTEVIGNVFEHPELLNK